MKQSATSAPPNARPALAAGGGFFSAHVLLMVEDKNLGGMTAN